MVGLYNQSDKKSQLKQVLKLKPIKTSFEICLVCSLNSQININRLGSKSNFGCKKNQTIVCKSKYIVLYIFAILVWTKMVWVICNTYNLHQTLKFFESFFYYSTLPIGFYLILTYIWSISLCKISQLQESEMRPTAWTLSYVFKH